MTLPAVPQPGDDLVPDGWADAVVVPWAEKQDEADLIEHAVAQVAGLVAAYRTVRADTLELVKARRYLEVRWGELLGETKPGQRTDLEPLRASNGPSLPRIERHRLRELARHAPEIRERVRQATESDEITRAVLLRGTRYTEDGDEWYTPRWLFDALGLRFDVDVCAPIDRTHVATPAERFYTAADDGLTHTWHGLAWCNPPYSTPEPWVRRMIDHGNGVLLSHVPINGLWALDAWDVCDALRLFQGVEFVRPSGLLQRPGYWLQLAAFGDVAAEALETMDERIDASVRDRFRPSRVFRWAA